MSRSISVAGVQMEVVPGNNNLAKIETYLQRLKKEFPAIELVLFSELCLCGNDPQYAMPLSSQVTRQLCSLAKENRVWLIPGSFYELTPTGIYNTAIVINPEGEVVSRFRKLFPWRPAEVCLAGNEFCVFEIPGRAKIGLCICYDQWFPEVTRQLTWMGAEIVLCPTMTATADRPQELILSQANAIANQLYFLNINGLGHGGNGQSLIVDPEGKIITQAGTQETILTAQLDMELVKTIREFGTLGECQVLKSFRECETTFPIYSQGIETGVGFSRLGAIEKKKN